jgi:hypothetical protein
VRAPGFEPWWVASHWTVLPLDYKPNRIFVHIYDAFLGIRPLWALFQKFLQVKPQPNKIPHVVDGSGDLDAREGARVVLWVQVDIPTRIGNISGSTSATTTLNYQNPACTTLNIIRCGVTSLTASNNMTKAVCWQEHCYMAWDTRGMDCVSTNKPEFHL